MQILAIHVGAFVQSAVVNAGTIQPVGPVVTVPFTQLQPTPDSAEVPAQDLWAAVTAASRQAGVDFPNIQGIGLAVLTPALVLLDKADVPLGPFWWPCDWRARPAARQVEAAVGDEILATTGNRALPDVSAIRFRQQLHDDPYLSHRVRGFLHLNGWLGLRITGARAFDLSNASCSGLFGTLTDHQWSKRWCDYFEVDPDWLAPVVAATATIGTVRSAVAAELGVVAGIPLKIGTAELSCAMLGADITSDDLFHDVGSVQTLATLVARPKPSPRVTTRLLGIGDAYVQAAYNPVGGTALEWIRKLCFRDQSEVEFYEQTLPVAATRSSRVLFDPPHLAGDVLEIESCRAAFRELTLAADRDDLLAALVQAMKRGHGRALEALGSRTRRQTVITGLARDQVSRLLLANDPCRVESVERRVFRGVARLWQPVAPS